MNVNAECCSLFGAVAQSHGCKHVAFGCNAHTRTASLRTLVLNLLPQMILGVLYVIALWVVADLIHYEVNLLKFKVDDVVHDALCLGYMLLEEVEVEACLRCKWILDVCVEVDGKQSARVVRTERYLAAGVGADGLEAEVGIAVGNAFAQNGVPEKYARLCTLPSIVYNLLPKLLGRDVLLHDRIVRIYRELLCIRFVFNSSLHEFVVNLYAHVGSSHLAFGHLGIDECLAVGMLDADRQHQCATTAVLCHLTC